jgi:murein DD-endopeptidase MepM/ murein hydrolase activator NlpD
MARSKWTLMLVPDDHDRVRSIQLTNRSVRIAISAVLCVALLSGSFTLAFFFKHSHELRAERLERENRLLAAEVEVMKDEMSKLSDSLDDLAGKEEKFRVMAGLPPTDADVRRVGIGGPGTETLASSPLYGLNSNVGEEVFEASSNLRYLSRQASLLRNNLDEAIERLQFNTERLEATPSIAPSSGHLSSLFSRNRRHPVLRITRPHNGIDIAAPVGEPIHASAKGRVIFAGMKSGGYGNTVEIDHGYGYVTRYAHASRVLVRTGQMVERGQLIAEVGATGLVSGPHLHYEVEVNGKQVDPLNFIIDDVLPD